MKNWFSVSALTAAMMLSVPAVMAEPIAFVHAKIHTLGKDGTLNDGTLVIDGGVIKAVGAGLAAPSDAKIIDATGKELTPGLANAYTDMGVEELSSIEQTVDSENSNPHFSVAFTLGDAINPNSVAIPVNRVLGLTRAVVVPHSSHNIFEGQAAVINLGTGLDLVVNPTAGLFVNLTESGVSIAGGSRAGALLALRQAFRESRQWFEHRNDFIPRVHPDYSLPEVDMEALQPFMNGLMPVVVEVHRASDIRAVLKLRQEFPGLKLVIAGGAEAWMVAEDLAAAKVPVILDPMQNLPVSFEQLGVRLDGAARLQKAGVKVLFCAEDTHKAFLVRQGAGNAVAYGMNYDEALKAMTSNIAEVFGMPKYGTLEVGKDADVVMWDGDPLEVTSNAEQVVIQGNLMPMVSRITRLRDRYQNLPPSEEPAYRK